ncbi:MAG TPA: hypothetical protein VFH54_02135 [Mycobacteriales bacterium]|nr:hypothetical protein [Mycobacteriales bacterium]
MTLTQAEHLAVLLAAASLFVAMGALGLAVVRWRRRWRSRRSMLRRLVRQPLSLLPLSRMSEGFITTMGSPSWWLVQRDRHAMWRDVAAARRAVAVATRAEAPVGDLPLLTRQLRDAAAGVDAQLRASSGELRVAREVEMDRVRIQKAAADIRASALASLGATRVDVQPVVSAISVEVAALAAGVQAARSH